MIFDQFHIIEKSISLVFFYFLTIFAYKTTKFFRETFFTVSPYFSRYSFF